MASTGILLDAFKLKPAEAIAYLKAKGNKFSWNWYDTWQEGHAKAFTVAKAMKMDVLKAIRQEVTKAIEGDWYDVLGPDGQTTRVKRGLTLQEFRKRLTPRLKSLGWWGKTTDEGGKEIQLGSPYRLATIYRTNMQTSYMAGRYKQQMAAVKALPYWQYVAVMDAKTRPAHRALNGKVFRADDRFWDTHYPPNGFGCRCRVRPMTASAVSREGITVQDSADKMVTKDVVVGGDDPRTVQVSGYKTMTGDGQPVTVWTDPGWNYNPGKAAIPPGLSLPPDGPPVAPSAPPAPAFPPAAALPSDLQGLTTIRKLGGSTGAVLAEDAGGARYVLKKGASEQHIREESLADRLYGAMGVDVPEHTIVETASGPVKVARFIDGTPLSQLKGARREAAVAKLREGFSADALLANHDVVGLAEDNILVDKAGRVWRIDNGGALRFRAQGKAKAGFDAYPTELWTMREAATNKATATVYAGLTHADVVAQSEALLQRSSAALGMVEDTGLRATLAARLGNMQDMVTTSKTLFADKWVDDYTGGFTRHVMGLRKAGVSAMLPKRLAMGRGTKYQVYDQDGVRWDKLRGKGSSIEQLAQYMSQTGGNYSLIASWLGAQGASSWSKEASAVKYFFAKQRGLALDTHYWSGGAAAAENLYKEVVAPQLDVYTRSMQAYHAYTYELLRTADIDLVDRARGTVRLIRTENARVLKSYKVKRGGPSVVMKRGPLESTSIYRAAMVHGSEVTVQDVPLHRVFSTYFHSRTPGGEYCALYGDAENEFVAFLDGVPLRYDPGYIGADGYVKAMK